MLLRKVIGNRLKYYRKRYDLSQHDVADKCNMDQKDISKVENHVDNIGVDKIDQICKGLQLHAYEMVIDFGEISVKDLLTKCVFTKEVVVMLYQYYMLMSRMLDEDSNRTYQAYGIGIVGQSVPCIKDISTDERFVQSLVDLCNLHCVNPVHLIDVIEDALHEKES